MSSLFEFSAVVDELADETLSCAAVRCSTVTAPPKRAVLLIPARIAPAAQVRPGSAALERSAACRSICAGAQLSTTPCATVRTGCECTQVGRRCRGPVSLPAFLLFQQSRVRAYCDADRLLSPDVPGELGALSQMVLGRDRCWLSHPRHDPGCGRMHETSCPRCDPESNAV